MKFVGLLSGGKDSLFAVGKALSMGHKLVCTANLFSSSEQDSYMFQTIGTLLVPAISSSLDVPLVNRELLGKSICKNLSYAITEKDEIEDLYELLLEAKFRFPEIQAVVSGAVFSDYQRIRVEHVCSRLGLASISPLWRLNQKELLVEMKEQGYSSIIVKISAMGLQEKHLGCEVTDFIDYFDSLQKKFGFNVAGEGGEYESLIIDAPIMKKKLIITESEKIVTGNSSYSPYGHLIIKKVLLEDKITKEAVEFQLEKSKYPSIHQRHGELFIGEITAESLGKECTTFEHETFCILKGLKEILEKNEMSLGNIYYVIAYIKDMKDYLLFNSVYSKFFSFPNPPSRVCCEVSSQACQVKISVKATLSKKKCTHIQSISSWAPANIGPYSQAYALNSSLHLAGSIPLIPQTMVLSPNSLDQIIENCRAVAKVNEFTLDEPETCVVYYTNEKIEVPESFNPMYVQVTGLPKNSPLEIEFHLQKNLSLIHKNTEEYENEHYKIKAFKRHCQDIVYANWWITIERVENHQQLIADISQQLNNWFNAVTHKSGINKEQLLGSEEIIVNFKDYITEIRVFAPEPYLYSIDWIKQLPTTYINSLTTAIYIQLQDYLQISTYQFINSGN